MVNLINIIIFFVAIFSTKATSQGFNENNYFCCSEYKVYKTSTENNQENNFVDKENYSSEIINIEANESFRDEKKQITILQGAAEISKGTEKLKSDLANILQNEDRARLSGNVIYENKELIIKSPYAEYNTNTERTDFIAPTYNHSSLNISGKASYGVHLKNKKMFLKNSSYTTCDLLNPDWNLISEVTELDFESGIGKSSNVFITIKDIPFFYSPFMQFSIDEQRKTGFLVPEFSGNWIKGPDIITPFYWNIAENMDMLIKPGYIQERGSLIESTYRYLNKNNAGSIHLFYLDNDSKYKKSGKNTKSNNDRYNFYFTHHQTFENNIEIDLLYDKFSDKDYFDDFGHGIFQSSTSYRTRHAKINYNFNGWDINSRFLGYQIFDKNISTSDQPYDILPEIIIKKRWDQNFINYDVDSSFSKWKHESEVDGSRIDFQLALDKTFSLKSLNIKPRFKIQHTSYNLDNQIEGYTSSPSKTIPIFTLDSELILSKKIASTNTVHQIKPRIFYLYSRRENQDDIPLFDTKLNEFSYDQLFRDNSFSGLDRNNDTNQLTLAISSNLYDVDKSRNTLIASIGQILYFDDRKVSTNNSNTVESRANSSIVAEILYQPTESINLKSTFMFDSKGGNDKTQKNIHSFQYRGKGSNVYNASYRYTKDDIEQGDISFVHQIKDNLNVLGRWNYDFKNNLNGKNDGDIETLSGLEYESCCWKMRVVHRKFKTNTENYEKDIYFQIMLKGLTDVGTPLGDIIASSIKGYMNKDKEY